MDFEGLIRTTAEEGAVLLKNEQSALPLNKNETLAVFGRCQIEYYRSGMGSGGSVHAVYTTNLIDSLNELSKEGKAPETYRPLEEAYRKWIKENPFDLGGGVWAGEPWSQKEMPLSEELVQSCANECTKAIFVLGRTAGEDKDNQSVKGSWYLTDTEKDSLKKICAHFKTVILVLNVTNIMDLAWLSEEDFKNIKAVLLAWQGGMEGGRACARLLSGIVSPSGKLTDTIARHIDDWPSTKNFGNSVRNFYEEDIFVGYRYFLTAAKEKILYPFGFGLSYTTFSTSCTAEKSGEGIDSKVTLTFTVKNTGSTSGKEIVQAYWSLPEGELSKPERILAAFKKTKLLSPGQSETLVLEVELKAAASYDDRENSTTKSAWILEKGEYKIAAGTDSLSAQVVEGSQIFAKETIVVKQCEQAAAPNIPFKRLTIKNVNGKPVESYEDTPLLKIDMAKRIRENLPKTIDYTGNMGISFSDVVEDKSKIDKFIAQIGEENLSAMVRGEGMMSQKVTVGIAAAYGGITDSLHEFGIPVAGCSDGPSGIRLDTGKEARLMPIGTLIACTWNPDLIEEMFVEEGKELQSYKIDSLLGPGVNIHRTPLNGRNFEYFSEDPYLSGVIATSVLRGLNKAGVSGTIKHFAANNQELARSDSDSVVSERALREIYLKAFEIAVKSGETISLMTSYNPVNGHQAASNYDLVNTILRKEWGYDGLVMTDWWAKMNDCASGGKASIKHAASMIRAGGDVYMVVDNDGAEKNQYGDDTLTSLAQGKLTLGELQASAKRIITFLIKAPVSKRPLRALKEIKNFTSKTLEPPAGEKRVNEKDDFEPLENTVTWLYAPQDAMYNISATYTKEGSTLSQAVANLLVDGAIAASLESRSTGNVPVTVNASQVFLHKGWYGITVNFMKRGISVKRVSFSSEVITPVSMGLYS